MNDTIQSQTAEAVLERLSFTAPPARTLDGLNALYRAWGRCVPFDNVRKRISLATADSGALPGGHAEEFFAAWLRHGTGGTCWPSSNGLHALLDWCGFDVRRIAGSMRDLGEPNHGSVIARLEEGEFLVDSSMLTEAVIPLRRGEHLQSQDVLHPIIVEPVDGSFRISFALGFSDQANFPCRLFEHVVDHPFYLARYEITRAPDKSPFNQALYATRNTEGAVLSYLGRTRIWKRPGAIEQSELDDRALARSLVEELGLSESIVAELAAAHALG